MHRLLPLLLLILAFPRIADACSCLESGAACEDYWKASAVFLGRVEKIDPPSKVLAPRRVTLTVIEAFSGVQKGTLEVRTGSSGADCGFAFREGGEYIVYAQRTGSSGALSVSLCSRTREVSRAAGDLDYARAVASGVPMKARISGDVDVRNAEPVAAAGAGAEAAS